MNETITVIEEATYPLLFKAIYYFVSIRLVMIYGLQL